MQTLHCSKCITEVRAKVDGELKVVGFHRGRIFLDSIFSENNHYEFFCIRCGHRPMVSKESVFGRWVTTNLTDTRMKSLAITM